MARDRLAVTAAGRLARMLQVLIQAQKADRDSISSQEIGQSTNINPSQVRRDLSGFGRFGKRGVGYNVDLLVDAVRSILRSAGQHNIVLIGAGRLGQAIASSPTFADHGFNIAAVFDSDPAKIGTPAGNRVVQPIHNLGRTIRDKNIVVGVLAVPDDAAQAAADGLVQGGVKIILSYSDALIQTPPDVTVHRKSPVVELLHALHFHLT